jgi:dihydrofolate synthase/folylpolyglutamate synthase
VSRLESFLDNKPLFYDDIDPNIMHKAYQEIRALFVHNAKVVHIIGTNGKGSTGRYLAKYLHYIGKSVGHYTSPHIEVFNERVWLNDKLVTDTRLDEAHDILQNSLSKSTIDQLSYFEYTTFVAMICFVEADVDYIVLEAGLGGEYDATTVFENDLTLLTTVDIDHTDFLGNTIEEITTTKVKAAKKHLIIGHQNHSKVTKIAHEVCDELNITCSDINNSLDEKELESIYQIKIANYLKNNLKLTISALKFLVCKKIDYNYFNNIEYFGRCQRISENITIDVGHNHLASKVLLDEFHGRKVDLVYNSFSDKDYESILKTLSPIINIVHIIDIDNNRIEKKEKLEKTIKKIGLNFDTFTTIDQNREYLVFGSFVVVEEFLKRYKKYER